MVPAGRRRAPARRAARRARRAPLRAALLVGLALLLSACTGAEDSGGQGYVSANGQVTQVPAEERGEPVELAGETVDGDRVALEDLRGQPVVVPVWGPWCAPCVKEAPVLADIARAYDDRAAFVGIAIKNDGRRADSLAFQREHDLPYPSLYSGDGSELLAFDGGPRPRAVPSLVLLDAEGRVASVILGDLPSRTTVTTLLDELVTDAGGGTDSGRLGLGGGRRWVTGSARPRRRAR